MTKELIRSRS